MLHIELYNTDHDDITEEHNNDGDKTSDTDKTSSGGDSSVVPGGFHRLLESIVEVLLLARFLLNPSGIFLGSEILRSF